MKLMRIAFMTFLCTIAITLIGCGGGGSTLPEPPVPTGGVLVTDNPSATDLSWDAIKALPVGTTLGLRLNRTGFEVHKYAVVYHGYDEATSERLIVCQTPETLNVGPGDSGSPLMYDGKIVGGLCYGYPGDNHTFYARFIEDVRAVTTATTRSLGSISSGYAQLQPQLVLKGATPAFVERANRLMANLDSVGDIRFGDENEGVSTKTEEGPNPIAGMSVAINEVSGPITLSSIGSITCAEQDQMFLFSHSLFNQGESASPAVLARAQGLSTSMLAGKLASPTEFQLGVADLDGAYSVRVNRQDRMPDLRTYPLTIDVNPFNADDPGVYRFEITPHNWGGLELDAVMSSVLWSLDDYLGRLGPGSGEVSIMITDQAGWIAKTNYRVGNEDYTSDVTMSMAMDIWWAIENLANPTASPGRIDIKVSLFDDITTTLVSHFVQLLDDVGIGDDVWPDATNTVHLKAYEVYRLMAYVPAWPEGVVTYTTTGDNCITEHQGRLDDLVFSTSPGTCEMTLTASEGHGDTTTEILTVVVEEEPSVY